jgi:Flp pilus assembly protein TadD
MRSAGLGALLALIFATVPVVATGDPSSPAVEQRRQSPAETTAQSEYNRGVRARVSKDWPTAVTAFRRAVDLRPDFADAWNELGYALRNVGK